MELTEQQRMDLINAGWTPPGQTEGRRDVLLKRWFFDDSAVSVLGKWIPREAGSKVVIYYGEYVGGTPHSETLTFTAEEYNAALDRYKA